MPMCVSKCYIGCKSIEIILLMQEKCCITYLFIMFLFVYVLLCRDFVYSVSKVSAVVSCIESVTDMVV